MSDTLERAAGLDHVTSPDFLANVETFSEKWDREWIRYFYIHEERQAYFRTYAGRDYPFPLSREDIAQFTALDSLNRRLDPELMHTKLQIHLPGAAFVDKDVFEIGCGVAMLGRLLSKLTNSYTGYDYSPLALQIARLTSPDNCRYVYAGDVEAVRSLRNTADLCFGRHFFIRNNFENATWVLRFLRDVLREDGIIHADFFQSDGPRERIFPAKSPLMEHIASCGFYYEDQDVYELAGLCGLQVESITRTDTPPRVYVNFRRDG